MGCGGCPTPPVSPRSAGCRRAPGCPTPPVSPRSTGCRRAPALSGWTVRLEVQAAQLRRYLPGQLVAGGTALPGWSGCPTPPVSPRSTGCCGGWLVRSGYLPQLRRYPCPPMSTGCCPWRCRGRPARPGIASGRHTESGWPYVSGVCTRSTGCPNSAGISPVNWLSAEVGQAAGISPVNWLLLRYR